METILVEHRVSEFLSELENRKTGKVDIVVPANRLSMKQDGSIHVGSERQVEYTFTPTDWAHGQIAEKLKIPKPYYDRMRDSAPELLAENVNTWFRQYASNGTLEDNLVLVRSWNGIMTALLSNRYRAIDNYDVADTVLKTVYHLRRSSNGESGIALTKAYVTDRVMNFQIVDTSTEYSPFADKPNDKYMPGMNVRNSEVGYSSFVVEPFLYRGICKNGMIFGFKGIREIHLGGRKDEGEYYSNRTAEFERLTIMSKIADITNNVFSANFYNDVMGVFRQLRNETLPPRVIDASIPLLGLTESEGKDIYRLLEGNTRYDFVQAVTSKANEYITADGNPERGYQIQKIGGTLVTDREIWKRIEEASKQL